MHELWYVDVVLCIVYDDVLYQMWVHPVHVYAHHKDNQCQCKEVLKVPVTVLALCSKLDKLSKFSPFFHGLIMLLACNNTFKVHSGNSHSMSW